MFNFKLYSFIFAAIVLIRAFMNFGKPVMGVYLLLTLADLLALFGVFTYSFRRPVIGAFFWKAFLLVYSAAVFYIFAQSVQTSGWSFLISIAFFSPALFILYLYGFQTNWKGAAGPTRQKKE